MLDILFKSITGGSVTSVSFFICSTASILIGLVIALLYKAGQRTSKGFFCALAVIPLLSQTLIMMVSGSLGAGIAVAGAFSLIRFRSVPGTAKEICSIFLAMTTGVACGMGYIGVAVSAAVLVEAICVVIFLLYKSESGMCLRITVPESLNHNTAFEDIFEKYTSKHELVSVRTQHMGSLYRLDYIVILKNMEHEKDFIDEIRCRNANLDVICSRIDEAKDEM